MSLKNATSALYLYPISPDWSTDFNKLSSTLSALGLIENNIQNLENSYYAGESFLHHVLFLGCSPAIQFKPTEKNTEKFCFVRLIFSDQIKLICTKKLPRPPHCPKCNKSFKQWHEFDIATQWRCPNCEKTSPPHEYNWKRSAGLARVFIEITDIYPKEAIPQSSLLDQLSSHTGVKWDYFYYCA